MRVARAMVAPRRAAVRGAASGSVLHVVFALSMAVVALIHLMPLIGVFGIDALRRLYAVEVDDASLVLLLRHRALLFGLLGALVLASLRTEALRGPALIAAWISCSGFLVLAAGVDGLDAAMQRVVLADQIALVALLVATLVHFAQRRDRETGSTPSSPSPSP